jgi:hypothetical protein
MSGQGYWIGRILPSPAVKIGNQLKQRDFRLACMVRTRLVSAGRQNRIVLPF